MMKKKSDIEQYLKSRLSQGSSEVSDEMWQKIANQLPQPTQEKTLLTLFWNRLGLILILVSIATVGFYIGVLKNENAELNKQLSNQANDKERKGNANQNNDLKSKIEQRRTKYERLGINVEDNENTLINQPKQNTLPKEAEIKSSHSVFKAKSSQAYENSKRKKTEVQVNLPLQVKNSIDLDPIKQDGESKHIESINAQNKRSYLSNRNKKMVDNKKSDEAGSMSKIWDEVTESSSSKGQVSILNINDDLNKSKNNIIYQSESLLGSESPIDKSRNNISAGYKKEFINPTSEHHHQNNLNPTSEHHHQNNLNPTSNQDTLIGQNGDSLSRDVLNKNSEVSSKKTSKTNDLFSVEVFFSPELAYRETKFKQASDEVKNYKSNDINKFNFSAGALVQYNIHHRFYLRSGLMYNGYGDRNNSTFQFKNIDTTGTRYEIKAQNTITSGFTDSILVLKSLDNLPLTTSSIFDLKSIPDFESGNYTLASATDKNGQTEERWQYSNRGQSVEYVISKRETEQSLSASTSSSIAYIGLPLIVGTGVQMGRFSLGIFSGVINNILLSPSSVKAYAILSQNGNDAKIVYKDLELNRFNFTYWGGVELAYKIGGYTTITLSPSVKYFINSIYKNSDVLEQRPFTRGVQLGLRIGF